MARDWRTEVERLTRVGALVTGARAFEEAFEDYRRVRDEHAVPMYEMTTQLATLEPPPPEMRQLLAAIHGKQEAMDRFVQMNARTITPAEFFSTARVAAA